MRNYIVYFQTVIILLMNAPCETLSSKVQPIEAASIKADEKPPASDKSESLTSKPQTKLNKNSMTASGAEPHTGPWTEEEHRLFLTAMDRFGNNWHKVCEYIGTRTPNQARSHAQKYYNRRRKLAIETTLADKSGKKKLFAVTREFVNRTAIKSALELMDVPSRVPKQKRKAPYDGTDNKEKESNKVEHEEVFMFIVNVINRLKNPKHLR